MRGILISIWNAIDPIYFRCTRLKCLSNKDKVNNIFRIRLTKYKGKNIILSDGTTINKNDTLVKIHLHNVKLLAELKGVKSEIKKGKTIYQHVLRSLPGVELFIREHEKSNEIKGIVGISLLNKGCERLGFEIIDISNPIYKWFKLLCFLPIATLSSNKLSFKLDNSPSYLFMSKTILSSMYRGKPPGKD